MVCGRAIKILWLSVTLGWFSAKHIVKKTEEEIINRRFMPSVFSAVISKNTMKNFFTTKRICRAGVIAALYVALTCCFGLIAYQGILQVRPAEALSILPLFFPEAVPALWTGCMLANLLSGYGIYDILLGGLATLIAACLTYGAGRLIKNRVLKIIVGGFFPVILNAIIVPIIIVFIAGDLCGYRTVGIAYWVNFGSMFATQALWIYGLGAPMCFAILRLRQKGVAAFSDGKKQEEQIRQQ